MAGGILFKLFGVVINTAISTSILKTEKNPLELTTFTAHF